MAFPHRTEGGNAALAAASVGVGLKPEHAAEAIGGCHGLGFFEVHAENYMGEGGPPHRLLTEIRARYPLSLHGVALSIGGVSPLDEEHLARLKHLIDCSRPALFSEHLAWSTHEGVYFNDLLPVPYDASTLLRVCEHIDQVQSALGRQMLLENPSTYVAFESSTMSEVEFLGEIVKRTGCGLLLDVNNVYVSAINHGFEPMAYIDAFPVEHVGEIHLGGFSEDRDDLDATFLIDSHATPVAEVVWLMYRRTIARTGPVPTLIEWDNDVPTFSMFVHEAARAKAIMSAVAWRRNDEIGASVPRSYAYAG